jgi:hypothetical protein
MASTQSNEKPQRSAKNAHLCATLLLLVVEVAGKMPSPREAMPPLAMTIDIHH